MLGILGSGIFVRHLLDPRRCAMVGDDAFPKAWTLVRLNLRKQRRDPSPGCIAGVDNTTVKHRKKNKKTPAVKFLDLIFRNNSFVFNFSKMCSR